MSEVSTNQARIAPPGDAMYFHGHDDIVYYLYACAYQGSVKSLRTHGWRKRSAIIGAFKVIFSNSNCAE